MKNIFSYIPSGFKINQRNNWKELWLPGLCIALFHFAGCKKEVNVDVLENNRMIEIITKTLKKNSNAIDVGCYKGEILESMLTAAPGGIHYAFEPIPKLYEDLLIQFKNRPARIEKIALGEKSGEEEFMHVLSNEPYSGFKQRKYERPDETIEKIRVRVEPMDARIPADLPISLIKIDVEGAELLVLKGGYETIKRNKPVIIFEHGLGASEFYGTGPEEVYSYLHDEMGLALNTLQNYLDEKEPLSREGFLDMYYKKKSYNYIAYPIKKE